MPDRISKYAQTEVGRGLASCSKGIQGSYEDAHRDVEVTREVGSREDIIGSFCLDQVHWNSHQRKAPLR